MSRARELARLGNINVITADNSFNVGLGTTASIQYKLDVIGDANFTGVVTATSFGGDGSNLTGIAVTSDINTNNIKVSGISTLGHATGTELKITGVSTFSNTVSLPDDKSIILGNDDDLEIHHAGGSNSYIKNNTLSLDIRGDTTNINSKNNSVTFLKANASGLMATTGISSIGSAKITDSTASTSTTTGALVVTGGVGIAGSLHVGENVTIGGTVTYEDVTNIDSVGVITARLGVKVTGGEIAVGAAFSVGQAGVVTATSYYGDGSTLTNAGITAGKAMGLAAFLG